MGTQVSKLVLIAVAAMALPLAGSMASGAGASGALGVPAAGGEAVRGRAA